MFTAQNDLPVEVWSTDKYEVQTLGLVDLTKRQSRVDGCTYCADFKPGDMMPSHDASSRCESGKRPHCTCDTCF